MPEDIVSVTGSNLSGRESSRRFKLASEIRDQKEVERYHAERRRRHPTLPSAGSVFRNPPGNPAGRLIEAAGGKGLSIGAARVSEKHANFIVNTGGASARDIESLIELIRQRVKDKFGVELETEVRSSAKRDK